MRRLKTLKMRKIRYFVLSALAAGLLAAAPLPSHAAVTLRQQWQAGQSLVYNTNIDGTMNLQIPPDVPIMIAGMPLEISVRAAGKTIVNTKSVTDFGDGVVQISMNPLNISAESFGQKALIGIKDGKATMQLNGAKQSLPQINWNLLTNPSGTLTISPTLKATDFSLKDATKTDDAAPTESSSILPANVLMMAQNLLLQSLPAMLPNKSVNEGDEWTSAVEFKASPAPNAPLLKLGNFTFQYKGAEGDLQHIAVKGDLALSTDQSRTLGDAIGSPKTGDAATKGLGQFADMFYKNLISFDQNVDGDLYFDSAAGHFSRANLNIDAHANTQPRTEESSTTNGYADFSGSVQYRLDK